MSFLALALTSPVYQQIAVLCILGLGLILFMKDRFRYDAVALFLMIAVMVLGILPYDTVLANFGHPAVVIVASMFIMSSALVHSGIIDAIMRKIGFLNKRPLLALTFLIILVAIISGFVNNIGALAMVIPIAIHVAHTSGTPVSFFLLPLAFASHLGGYLTLIGTPRNILISDFREQATGVPYQMFDFLPVGGMILVAGVLFLIVYAWRFSSRHASHIQNGVFARHYITEVAVTAKTKVCNLEIARIYSRTKQTIDVIQVFRNNAPLAFSPTTTIHEGDTITLSGTEENLTAAVEKLRFELTGMRAIEKFVTNADDYSSFEVLVPPYSKLAGRSWNEIKLRDRFGTNFIGLFRRNFTPHTLLSDTHIIGNDIILLQGRTESVRSTIESLRLVPLATSDIHLGRTTTILATLTIVISVIALATFSVFPLPLLFLCGVMLLVGTNLISLKGAYESIDWPVLVLLAGMITLGDALHASGAADSLANAILGISTIVSPVVMLGIVLVAAMLLSDFINTTASAVIMAPIAILVAGGIGASVDPFLMAVAIGASSAYLTPVGHESNALVMQKGGYRFRDFTIIGLPLELIIVVISLPLILYVWPL